MNLKKILILAAAITVILGGLAFLFLMPSEELGPITIEAQELVKANEKEQALLFLIENEANLDNEGLKLKEDLQAEIYALYVGEAQKAIDEEDYILAYERYQLLVQFAPEKDVETIKKNLRNLEKNVNEIKTLEKAYTSYLLTFETALEDSNDLLISFKSSLDKYEIGMYSAEEFKAEFNDALDVSNGILTTLDSGLKTNNQELLSIHKDMFNLMNEQHNMIIAALKINNEDKDSVINKFKKTYLDIKEEQISIIQSLQNFALENNLNGSVLSDTGEVTEEKQAVPTTVEGTDDVELEEPTTDLD